MLVLASVLHSLIAVAISLSDEESFAEINDLGNLLLGGFVLVVGLAIAFTFVRFRMREKNPPAAKFISINPLDKKE